MHRSRDTTQQPFWEPIIFHWWYASQPSQHCSFYCNLATCLSQSRHTFWTVTLLSWKIQEVRYHFFFLCQITGLLLTFDFIPDNETRDESVRWRHPGCQTALINLTLVIARHSLATALEKGCRFLHPSSTLQKLLQQGCSDEFCCTHSLCIQPVYSLLMENILTLFFLMYDDAFTV